MGTWTLRESYWTHKFDKDNKNNDFINYNYFDMLIGGEGFWLATRDVRFDKTLTTFSLSLISKNSNNTYLVVGDAGKYNTNNNVDKGNLLNSLFPIVSINLQTSGFSLIKDESVDSTEYKLIKN